MLTLCEIPRTMERESIERLIDQIGSLFKSLTGLIACHDADGSFIYCADVDDARRTAFCNAQFFATGFVSADSFARENSERAAASVEIADGKRSGPACPTLDRDRSRIRGEVRREGDQVKRSQITAWDFVWRDTEDIHLTGSQLTPTAHASQVRDALSRLCKMKLPIDAIGAIGDAIRAAHHVGRDGTSIETNAQAERDSARESLRESAKETANVDSRLSAASKEMEGMRALLKECDRLLCSHHDSAFWDEEHARKNNYSCPICGSIFSRIAFAVEGKTVLHIAVNDAAALFPHSKEGNQS